jgi:hypothetical protein
LLIFDPKKCYNPLPPPVLSRFISTRLFSVSQVENEVKWTHFADVAEIQEAVIDELKKAQKRNFWQLFRNRMTAQKPVYMPMEPTLNKKKVMCLPCMSSILKKISPKTFGTHCVCLRAHGGAVVEALRYKPEGRGIDSRWCQNFSLT